MTMKALSGGRRETPRGAAGPSGAGSGLGYGGAVVPLIAGGIGCAGLAVSGQWAVLLGAALAVVLAGACVLRASEQRAWRQEADIAASRARRERDEQWRVALDMAARAAALQRRPATAADVFVTVDVVDVERQAAAR